jgi:hypothetical protein
MNKTLYILFLVLSLCGFVAVSIAWGFTIREVRDLKAQNSELNKQLSELNLKADNLRMMAFPKTFENRNQLDKFMLTTKDKSKYDYYSEASIELMNEAKEAGYWLGLIPVKAKYDYKGNPASLEVPIGGGGYIVNVAVVGGTDVYIVDPCTGVKLKVTEMQYELEWR